MSFASLNLPENLLQAVTDLGYTTPTPVQREAIPPAREGRDVLACAMTGSGKTAAFVLPMLERLAASAVASRPGSPASPGVQRGAAKSPRALVLAPTRELAAQITEQFAALGRHGKLRSTAVFGGVGIGPQEQALRRGVDVLVATPGRLLDHLGHPYLSLSGVEILVLDEADRMLDMGFLPDLRRILSHVPKDRQTLLFSATMPREILGLARDTMRTPVEIAIDRQAQPATGVNQTVWPVPETLKSHLLLELLRREPIKNLLVFTRTKHRANRLADWLGKNGVACERIHGNRSQAQRTEALARFKDGRARVLVATDVAARGIDVEALSHVLNYDVPAVPEDYVHRVGRTARAAATGDAWTFASDGERHDLQAIERNVSQRIPRRTLEGFDYNSRPNEALEIPLAQRIAEIRARKAEERARAKVNAERRARGGAAPTPGAARPAGPAASRPGSRPGRPGRPARPGQQGGRPDRTASPRTPTVGNNPAAASHTGHGGHGTSTVRQGGRPDSRPNSEGRAGGNTTRPAGRDGRDPWWSQPGNPRR